ncbi:hypothetical protein HS5152_2577 [Enterococcus faecalis]|nr:hypothetical protein HS5152_2577 [Enterococcus faecalis]OSH16091.1 hypothetical protein HS5302_1583 [Enterococcus faecalis]
MIFFFIYVRSFVFNSSIKYRTAKVTTAVLYLILSFLVFRLMVLRRGSK